MFACVAAADVSDVSADGAAALVALARDFSPRYEVVRDDLVIIDVSGLGRLLGTPHDIANACARIARERGLYVGIAVAATQTAAMLLALSHAAPAGDGYIADTGEGDTGVQAPPGRGDNAGAGGAEAAAEAGAEALAEAAAEDVGDSADRRHRHGHEHGLGRAHGSIVVPPGQEAAALAPLSLGWLAALPVVGSAADAAYLRRVQPGLPPGAAQGKARAQSASPRSAGAGAGAEAIRGKTRGKRGRLSGFNYRLAPPPLPAETPAIVSKTVASTRTAISAVSASASFSTAASASALTSMPSIPPASASRGVAGTLSPPRTARERAASEARAVVLETLDRWGLKTCGDFARLPVVEVFERLGDAGVHLQQIARGQDARPLVHTPVEEPFDATFALEWPIETLEPLSFVVMRLLEPLCARLERADRAAAALDTTLQLVTRARYTCRLELPTAIRDAKVLRTLVLLDLESHPPTAGIDRVTITIHPTPGRIVQHSLLTRALPPPEQLSTLIARLTAIMGEGRVGAPALPDTHRPEAFEMRSFTPAEQVIAPAARRVLAPASPAAPISAPLSAAWLTLMAPALAYRTLRRFRQPVFAQVTVEEGRPVYVMPQGLPGGPVTQAAGPWRTSGEWWTADADHPDRDRAWDRDEWDVSLANGHVYHLHHDRACAHWFVAACYD
jgi:protein ImuB